MISYYGKKIVIIGLGLTGFSCLNFFLTRGIVPRVIDMCVTPFKGNKLPEQVEYHFGEINDKWLIEADLLIISPGISLTNSSLSAAINAGVEIISDIELFFREANAPVVAITGSNGKSTVTALIGEMAKKAGINVGIGGNIGLPALMLLDSTYDLYILELSSFQLENTFSMHTIAATILNISEDHMDRYPLGLQQYRKAKLRIYNNAEVCVVNADDPLTIPMHTTNNDYISFGINVGDYRINCCENEIWLQVRGKKILNVKEMNLSGRHNYINALAALALSDVIGLPRVTSLKALVAFSGLTHRFQLVLERNGVCWIDDSKATNVSSTVAALNSVQFDGKLYLLLGGDGKSADFSPLARHFSNVNIRPYCFGRDGAILAELHPYVAQKTKTMEEAIYQIVPQLNPGDTVLLSPACSSLDQFKNFEQRGNIFTQLAKKLT